MLLGEDFFVKLLNVILQVFITLKQILAGGMAQVVSACLASLRL
jgi:hypothetical protein